jgi:hypothetical protein
MAAVSQGSTVSFDGGNIGSLVGFTASPAQAVTTDATGVSATIWGTGVDTRVVKRLECTAVDPGTVSVRLLGCPPYAVSDIGTKADLTVTFEGGSISWDAILLSFEVEGSVGELLRGTATFQFTGG